MYWAHATRIPCDWNISGAILVMADCIEEHFQSHRFLLLVKTGIGVSITQFSSSHRMLARKKYASKSFSKVYYYRETITQTGVWAYTLYVLASKAILISFLGINRRVHMLHFRPSYYIFCSIWSGWIVLHRFFSVECLHQRDGVCTHSLLYSQWF